MFLTKEKVVGDDSHIQCNVLASEETTAKQQVSHRPIECQSRSWSQKRYEGQRVRSTKFSSVKTDREILIFPVQLTTSKIGNLTRLIHTLAICVTIHHGDNPPLKPTGIQIATKILPGLTTRRVQYQYDGALETSGSRPFFLLPSFSPPPPSPPLSSIEPLQK